MGQWRELANPLSTGDFNMGESVKAILSLVMIVAAFVAAFGWIEDQPDQTTWILRIGAPLIGVLALAVLLKLQFRKDRAPDLLGELLGNYFNRAGFCFAFTVDATDGICRIHAYFQNQYERPCVGRVALRPGRGFFLTRVKIDTFVFEIPCDGGAFGVASLPISLPLQLQGKRQSFEVGASVEYPEGKGRRLRYRDGQFLRTNTNFGNAFATALTVAGALGGQIVLSSPATVTLQLPNTAVEQAPEEAAPQLQTLWKPDASPLQA
jgi:hypothetical protein